jgi:hypothetical protein
MSVGNSVIMTKFVGARRRMGCVGVKECSGVDFS